MTVFAISAAERICGTFGARAFDIRRETVFFRVGLDAVPSSAGLGCAAFGARAELDANDALRNAGLSFKVAAGRGGRALPAASTCRRACLAAFFAALNTLRACLSCALAMRTWLLAAAARAAALAAAVLSRVRDGLAVIYGNTRNKN